MQELKKNKKGFTLVELVVVIAILAVLVTLIVPKIMGNVADAQKNTEIGNARTLASDITVWNAQKPSTEWVVELDATKDNIITKADYVNRIPLPAGVVWPSGKYANITIDSLGNASVSITAP